MNATQKESNDKKETTKKPVSRIERRQNRIKKLKAKLQLEEEKLQSDVKIFEEKKNGRTRKERNKILILVGYATEKILKHNETPMQLAKDFSNAILGHLTPKKLNPNLNEKQKEKERKYIETEKKNYKLIEKFLEELLAEKGQPEASPARAEVHPEAPKAPPERPKPQKPDQKPIRPAEKLQKEAETTTDMAIEEDGYTEV